MLKTHTKSLLALALVPALLVAQLSGLMGSVPGASASTFYVTATSSVAAGGTVTVTASGLPTSTPVVVTVNAPYTSVSTNHEGALGTTINGDTSEGIPTAGAASGLPFTGNFSAAGAYPNALVQTTTSSTSGTIQVSFVLPGSAAPGVYGVTVYDSSAAGDTGSTTFTVSGSNSLLINGSTGTISVPLGGQVSAYYGSFTAGSKVGFSLENFAQTAAPAGVPGTGADGTTNTPSGIGPLATTGSVPLVVVSCGTGAVRNADNSCTLEAGVTALNATIQLSSANATQILSSAFYDQVYTIVASGSGGGSTTGGTVTVASGSTTGGTVAIASTPGAAPALAVTTAALGGTLTFANNPTTGGTFTLTVGTTAPTVTTETTGNITFDSTVGNLQTNIDTALDLVGAVGAGGSATVCSGTSPNFTCVVTFTAPPANATATLQAASAKSYSLSGGSPSSNNTLTFTNPVDGAAFSLGTTSVAHPSLAPVSVTYSATALTLQTNIQNALDGMLSVGAGHATALCTTPTSCSVTFSTPTDADVALTPVASESMTLAGSGTLSFTNPSASGQFTLSVQNSAVGAGTEITDLITYPASATTLTLASAISTQLNLLPFVSTNAGSATVNCTTVTACSVTFNGAAASASLVPGTQSLSISGGGGSVTEAAGIKLDHGMPTLTVGNTLVAPGATVSVSGYNFAAGSTVVFYFGDQIGGSPSCSFGTATVQGSVDAGYTSTGSTSGSVTASCGSLLSSGATVGANGSFSGVSLTLPSTSTNGSYSGGKILAEDVAPATISTFTAAQVDNEAQRRLNENAYVSLFVSSTANLSGGLTLSSYTPAINQTVSFTGTGFTASTATAPQYVTLSLSGGTNCSSFPFPQTLVNTAGVAQGVFTVPTTCGLAGGNSVTASLTGSAASGSSQTLSATFTVPSTAITANSNGTTITFTGTGFYGGATAGEQVAIQLFSTVSTGTAGIPLEIVTANADGSIAGTGAVPSGLATGYYFIEASGIDAGSPTATANVGYSVGGVLTCPSTAVIPGQTVTVTGTQFSVPPAGYSSTYGVNFSPTPIGPVTMTVDASGNMTSTFTVPTGTISGTYTLTANAYVPGVTTPQSRFCVISVVTGKVATLAASATSAPIGGTVSITGTGFVGSEPVSVALQYPTGSSLAGTNVSGTAQTFVADATGMITGTYTVQSSVGALVAGTYSLAATGTQSTLTASVTPFVVLPQGTLIGTKNAIYFAEGFTGQTSGGSSANFNESISILNANNFTTTYTVTYLIENAGAASTAQAVSGQIGPFSVKEQNVNTDAGANKEVGAVVTSDAPLAATRIISRTAADGTALDSSSSLGQQLDLTATAPSTGFDYYFAAGAATVTNEEYLTLLNPNSTAASVTVNILPQSAISSTTTPTVTPITLTVPANSRLTEHIRKDAVSQKIANYGLDVNSSVPVAVERVEYYGDGSGSAKYGADAKPAGTSAYHQYIFAYDAGTWPSAGGNSAVGTGSDVSEVDIVNPAPATAGTGSATVTVSFFDKSGNAINSQQVQVDPGTRETVSVNDVAGAQSDVFSTVVTSDQNIFVERPTFYGGNGAQGGKYAAATLSGAPAGLTSVAFPYLDTATSSGAVISQTVYLYNPGANTITVRGIYAAGSVNVMKTYSVASNSILAVNVNADASTLKGAIGGLFQVVQSAGGADAFVAAVVSNSPDYKMVDANQGTYPIAAATGQ